MNNNISNECRELILEKGEREFFMDINLNCLIFSLINEFRFDLYMWVLVNLTGKVPNCWIRFIGFNSHLLQNQLAFCLILSQIRDLGFNSKFITRFHLFIIFILFYLNLCIFGPLFSKFLFSRCHVFIIIFKLPCLGRSPLFMVININAFFFTKLMSNRD